MSEKTQLSDERIQELKEILQKRFEKNKHRHPSIQWSEVLKKIEANPEKLSIINNMEETEGEPDVVELNSKKSEIIFCDCAKESPKGRRSFCYDQEALDSRKLHKPENSVVEFAKEIGVEILDEEQYHSLQKLENFDNKTSSWLKTPKEVRELGGAIFGDHRFGRVFIYHNGAESYYGGRGFRGYIVL